MMISGNDSIINGNDDSIDDSGSGHWWWNIVAISNGNNKQ
jgi:hypothetical protein